MGAPTRDVAGFAQRSDHDRSRLAAAPLLAKLRVEDLRRIAARQGEWRERLGLDHAPECTCFTCWRNQN